MIPDWGTLPRLYLLNIRCKPDQLMIFTFTLQQPLVTSFVEAWSRLHTPMDSYLKVGAMYDRAPRGTLHGDGQSP